MIDTPEYEAILLVSFGGPDKRDDVIPFLENVLRGRNVPRKRMLEVAEHYYHFGGVSPINGQNLALIAALRSFLAQHGPDLPIYWGNRNWHPLLTETLEQMKQDGIQHALALVTSAYSSYSGCRQYREDIQRAQEAVGQGAPQIDKLRTFFNHPGFIEASAERVRNALDQIPPQRHSTTQLVFTAHSIPLSMSSGCDYENQLREACRLVSEMVGHSNSTLVYQSRSGPPTQPWLEPDILDYLRDVNTGQQATDVVLMPIGFISDHMEVLFDLDTEARELCDELELNMVRAKTIGCHPRFIRMIQELILERTAGTPKTYLGESGASHDDCPADCCLIKRPAEAPSADRKSN